VALSPDGRQLIASADGFDFRSPTGTLLYSTGAIFIFEHGPDGFVEIKRIVEQTSSYQYFGIGLTW
jgi:hypothetical protein